MAVTVLAAYDVADDHRRSRLAAMLQCWGDRLQMSVLLLRLDPDDLAGLEERARALLDTDHDSLYFVRVCKDCWGQHTAIGQAFLAPPTLMWAVL